MPAMHFHKERDVCSLCGHGLPKNLCTTKIGRLWRGEQHLWSFFGILSLKSKHISLLSMDFKEMLGLLPELYGWMISKKWPSSPFLSISSSEFLCLDP